MKGFAEILGVCKYCSSYSGGKTVHLCEKYGRPVSAETPCRKIKPAVKRLIAAQAEPEPQGETA